MCKVIKRGCLFVFVIIFGLVGYLELSFWWERYQFSRLPDYVEGIVDLQKGIPINEQTVVFAVCGVNLSSTTRMIAIADFLRKNYPGIKIVFFSHGGVGSFDYTNLIEESGYEHILVDPLFQSEDEVERFYQIDKGEIIDDMFSLDVLRERVKNELALFQDLQPTVVVTGFVLSAKLSCAIANVPLFFHIPLITVNWDYYINALPVLGDSAKLFLKEYFPRKMFNRAVIGLMRRIWYQTKNFKSVAKEYGINPRIFSMYDLFLGDKTLVTDIPQLVKVSPEDLEPTFGSGCVFVGALFARLHREIPEYLLEKIQTAKDNGLKILYFAMGSSGDSQVVKNILGALDSTLRHTQRLDSIGLVISPTWRLIEKLDVEEGRALVAGLHERIQVTDLLPAPKVNLLSDFAILHGGSGTIQTAITQGLPFVGVPAQIEQENNIKTVVENIGSALYVPKVLALRNGSFVVDKLCELMENDRFGDNAARFKEQVALEYNAEEIILELILEEVRKRM